MTTRLRELLGKATKGRYNHSREDMISYDAHGKPFARIYADKSVVNLGMHPSGLVGAGQPKELPLPVTIATFIEEHPSIDCKANAKLFAEAVNTLPALLDALDEAREALRFYSKSSRYDPQYGVVVIEDRGKQAREAISKINEVMK